MGEGNDGGLWGDPLGEGQGQKVCLKKVSQRGSGRLQSYLAGWGLSSGKKVRAEVTLPMNFRSCRWLLLGWQG